MNHLLYLQDILACINTTGDLLTVKYTLSEFGEIHISMQTPPQARFRRFLSLLHPTLASVAKLLLSILGPSSSSWYHGSVLFQSIRRNRATWVSQLGSFVTHSHYFLDHQFFLILAHIDDVPLIYILLYGLHLNTTILFLLLFMCSTCVRVQ